MYKSWTYSIVNVCTWKSWTLLQYSCVHVQILNISTVLVCSCINIKRFYSTYCVHVDILNFFAMHVHKMWSISYLEIHTFKLIRVNSKIDNAILLTILSRTKNIIMSKNYFIKGRLYEILLYFNTRVTCMTAKTSDIFCHKMPTHI